MVKLCALRQAEIDLASWRANGGAFKPVVVVGGDLGVGLEGGYEGRHAGGRWGQVRTLGARRRSGQPWTSARPMRSGRGEARACPAAAPGVGLDRGPLPLPCGAATPTRRARPGREGAFLARLRRRRIIPASRAHAAQPAGEPTQAGPGPSSTAVAARSASGTVRVRRTSSRRSVSSSTRSCLWTTRYQQATLDALRAEGADIRDEDVARLSPLGTEHVNVLGRYHFEFDGPVARGGLRPLRDPTATGEEW